MKMIADTNTFLSVTLYEPERDEIINLTLGHDLVAPDIKRTGKESFKHSYNAR